MTNRTMEFGIRITADGKVAVGEAEKVKKSLGDIGGHAEQANRRVEQSSKQAAFAMHMLPAQMTDIAVGLSTGQSPFMVLMQQGGQLKDMFGGIGPAMRAVGGYVMSMVNPFTIAAAAAAALGYALKRSFDDPREPAKDLETAVGDLGKVVGDVGKATREFSMDNVYKEFNKANRVTREGIVAQLEYQRAMIETQQVMAKQSLAKSVENMGGYVSVDKLQGGVGIDTLAQHLGISTRHAWDMLKPLQEINAESGDAVAFMERFGVILARSSKGAAQQLVKDIKAVADGSRDSAAALARIEEARREMVAAGSGGQIAIPDKSKKVDNGIDDFAREQAKQYGSLYEASLKYAEGVELQALAGAKLTEGEKLLAAAKAHLTEAQYREVDAVLAGAIARDKWLRAEDESKKRETERLDAQWKSIEAGDAEIRKLQEHNAEIGLSAEQLDALRLARMDDAIAVKERQLAIAESTSASAAEIEALRIQIEQMRQLRALTGKGQSLDRSHRESVDMWQSIERAAHDTWGAVGRDGENAFKSIGRSLKSAVLDVLYQMTVKKWIINIATAVSGGGVAGNAFGSSISGALAGAFDRVLVSQFGIGGFSNAELAAANAGFYDNATGGIYSSPSLHRYVNTVVDQPTLFNFAQGGAFSNVGRMGEKPGSPGEAIMPLARLSGGDLGVKVSMGATERAPVVYQAHFAIDARGADAGSELRIRQAMRETEARIKAWMMGSLNGGGELAYATGRRR